MPKCRHRPEIFRRRAPPFAMKGGGPSWATASTREKLDQRYDATPPSGRPSTAEWLGEILRIVWAIVGRVGEANVRTPRATSCAELSFNMHPGNRQAELGSRRRRSWEVIGQSIQRTPSLAGSKWQSIFRFSKSMLLIWKSASTVSPPPDR